jgi:subfamily B ATP-binding cassette protein MsbA
MNVAMSVGALTGLYATFKQALGSTEHVRELLDTAPRVLDAPDAKALPARAEGRVELRGVRFAYASAEGRPALRGLDLEAKPGEVVALVGPSGAGKSTVVNLVLRYYDADAGSVLLDGSDVKTLRLESLRAAIGLVPQEIFLFGGTIGDNIRYGRPGASDADVRAAAAAAQAAGFIERLPKAYDSVVGERGVRLSAGERQRIAIARVFLKDPSIIVLDEATSALDAESEHLVSRALERLMAGRTTLVVAHRLSTVRRATRVALVEAGRIADEGPHGELFARNALYRRLCELQMLAGTAADEATPAA